jgi:hypothetical protein
MNSVLRGVVALLAVALLVAAAASAGSVALQQTDTTGQTTITGHDNGTNYLSPTSTAVQGYDRVTADVASTASIAAQELHSTHDTRTYAEQLQSANTTERQLVADGQLDRVESRFEALARQQSQLYQSYADGEISDRTLLRKLVTFRIVADTQVQNYERAAGSTDLGIRRLSQLETLSAGLTPEQPVLDWVEQTLSTSEPRVIYLAAAGEGLTLATVTEDEYVRQATVLEERDFQGQDQFKLDQNITIDDEQWATPQGYSEAQNRLAELYPWAYDLTEVRADVEQLSRTYKFDIATAQGELTTYFDGATRNVFHENQVGSPTQRAVEGVVTNGTDGLNVSVSLTHDTGPVNIEVTDDGAPVVNAVVKIGDDTVGQTSNRGELWAIQPRGGFEVTATVDGDTVSVSVP